MIFTFNARTGPIFVDASLSGPCGQADIRLILDTGATRTLIRTPILLAVGYDPDASLDRVTVVMGNGSIEVGRVKLNRLSSLGLHQLGFAVIGHSLPPSSGIDGLLGLDFFRGRDLTLAFTKGEIVLT